MASHHRLSITLKQRSTLTPLAFHPIVIPTHHLLLYRQYLFLPLNFRKFILTVCRVRKTNFIEPLSICGVRRFTGHGRIASGNQNISSVLWYPSSDPQDRHRGLPRYDFPLASRMFCFILFHPRGINNPSTRIQRSACQRIWQRIQCRNELGSIFADVGLHWYIRRYTIKDQLPAWWLHQP